MTLAKHEGGGVSCVPTSQTVVQKSVDHRSEQKWQVETTLSSASVVGRRSSRAQMYKYFSAMSFQTHHTCYEHSSTLGFPMLPQNRPKIIAAAMRSHSPHLGRGIPLTRPSLLSNEQYPREGVPLSRR